MFEAEADFGEPQWQFGQSSYQPLRGDRLVTAYYQGGVNRLGLITGGSLEELESSYSRHQGLVSDADHRAWFVGFHTGRMRELVELDLDTGETSVVAAIAASTGLLQDLATRGDAALRAMAVKDLTCLLHAGAPHLPHIGGRVGPCFPVSADQ